MADTEWHGENEVSLLAVGTALLRHRKRIIRWMFIGALVAVLPILFKPTVYSSSASFVAQGSDPGRSGLASLAGQFGVALSAGNQAQSPDFFASLLKSRELLTPITRDTFVVKERNGVRVPFAELFGVKAESEKLREELAAQTLLGLVTTSVTKMTGVIQVSVATRWPSISTALVTALVDGVNDFNTRTRRSQAAAERKFIEGRLDVARVDLRSAEDRLERFLMTNRGSGSPELAFMRDRLQRDIGLQQAVFTSLTQAYEEARIREVRDTPVITLIESPSAPVRPMARGRAKRGLLGLLIGGFLGVIFALVSDGMSRRRAAADRDASEFISVLNDLKSGMAKSLRRIRRGSWRVKESDAG